MDERVGHGNVFIRILKGMIERSEGAIERVGRKLGALFKLITPAQVGVQVVEDPEQAYSECPFCKPQGFVTAIPTGLLRNRPNSPKHCWIRGVGLNRSLLSDFDVVAVKFRTALRTIVSMSIQGVSLFKCGYWKLSRLVDAMVGINRT